MTRTIHCILIVVLLTAPLFAATPSADTEKLWSLEKAHWEYVQANDLQKFLTLWHTDFLGWPSTSPEPLRKDHITDWITAHTSRGESLQSYDLEPLSTQVTGDIATTTYRVRLRWADKAGGGRPSTIRVIHTWVRSPSGIWQIISGMSAPTNAEGH
jgi:ketosteroid isomerase-like protein